MSNQTREAELVCQECSRRSDPGARRWRVYLNDVNEPVAYCAECADREFGIPSRSFET